MSRHLSAPVASLQRRWDRVWESMDREGLTCLVVRGRGVIGSYGLFHYLSDYFPSPKGSFLVLRLGAAPSVLLSSESEVEWALASADSEVTYNAVGARGIDGVVAEIGDLTSRPVIGTVAPGGRGLPARDEARLFDSFPGGEVREATHVVMGAKLEKDESDWTGLKEAARIAEAGIDAFARVAAPGLTEREGAAAIESELTRRGALVSLVFVAAEIYLDQRPTDRVLGVGDIVSVLAEVAGPSGHWAEVGALFAVGELPPRSRILAEACIGVLTSATDSLHVDLQCSKIAQQMLEPSPGWIDAGLGLGHGVGIDEEPPVISLAEEARTREGSAFAIHPSIRTQGLSVTAANTVILKDRGTEVLSKYPTRVWTV